MCSVFLSFLYHSKRSFLLFIQSLDFTAEGTGIFWTYITLLTSVYETAKFDTPAYLETYDQTVQHFDQIIRKVVSYALIWRIIIIT